MNNNKLAFLRWFKNNDKKIGVKNKKAEILVARAIPENKDSNNNFLKLYFWKIFKEKRILAKKQKRRIDSVVPKWADWIKPGRKIKIKVVIKIVFLSLKKWLRIK